MYLATPRLSLKTIADEGYLHQTATAAAEEVYKHTYVGAPLPKNEDFRLRWGAVQVEESYSL